MLVPGGRSQRLFSITKPSLPAIFLPRDETVYLRNPAIEGAMHAFGTGRMFGYEVLNFTDGERTVRDIRDWPSRSRRCL